jgi:hypothetical protein
MTVKTFENKSGDVFEWEETPESIKALEIYWQIVEENKKNVG